jgi:hypothetical protein
VAALGDKIDIAFPAFQASTILLISPSIMKKIFVGMLTFTVAMSAFAGIRFDAKTWRGVQTYDVRTLSKGLDSHIGEVVALHFSFRGKDIHHMKPNWYESSIWQPDPQGKKGFSDVRVMVAKQDLNTFKSFPTSPSGAEITVYGKVLRDSEAHFVFVRLLGRNTITDPAGNVIVSW